MAMLTDREIKQNLKIQTKFFYGENLDLIFGDLCAAHKSNDVAVLGLYGLAANASDEEVLEELMERYVRMR